MRVLRLGCLISLLTAAACTGNPPQVSDRRPTARDDTPDRILVTVAAPAPAATLSPSGRLGYRTDPRQQRDRLAQTAETLAKDFNLQLEEDWPIPALGVHCFVFRLVNATRRENVLAQLEKEPSVESAQPMHFFETQASLDPGDRPKRTSDDPLAGWNEELNGTLHQVHQDTTGKSVSIAVIDAGADLEHEDLRGAPIKVLDAVDAAAVPAEAHGTAIVGLLSARPGNGVGIRGYAPDANILLIRACWEDGNGETAICNSFTLAKALSFALDAKTDVVNLSVFGPHDPLLQRLAEKMTQRGQLIVAAGVEGTGFPAGLPNAIVASRYIRDSDSAISFTLLPNDRYGMRKGSSIAAAKVSAAVALVKQLQPGLTADGFHAMMTRHDGERVARVPNIVQLLHAATPIP